MENKVRNLLLKIGIDPSLLGYNYLVDAISLCYSNTTYSRGITKLLYPYLARQNNSTPARVERAIRHAIEKATLMSTAMFEILLLYPDVEKTKYTNSQFICACVEKLKLEENDA